MRGKAQPLGKLPFLLHNPFIPLFHICLFSPPACSSFLCPVLFPFLFLSATPSFPHCFTLPRPSPFTVHSSPSTIAVHSLPSAIPVITSPCYYPFPFLLSLPLLTSPSSPPLLSSSFLLLPSTLIQPTSQGDTVLLPTALMLKVTVETRRSLPHHMKLLEESESCNVYCIQCM